MFALRDKSVLVAGLGVSGEAAAGLLLARGARVLGLDLRATPAVTAAAERLNARGVRTLVGTTEVPQEEFDLVVVSPEMPPSHRVIKEIAHRDVPIISELELGYEQALCLNISICGSNGKSTTASLVEKILTAKGIRTLVAGNVERPISAAVEASREQDFLTLEVGAHQLEAIRFFRPAVAVMLNIAPDHFERFPTPHDYVRAMARLFENQQPFDWAIIQAEALAQLRALNVKIPSKIITFSAASRRADIYLDRGLLISQLDGWEGPLLNLDECRLSGSHNAENLMAALAVGRVLRLPLKEMLPVLQQAGTRPHCSEEVAQVNGVRYVDDSKGRNPHALQQALLSMRPGQNPGEPNLWLIAGGKDRGADFHDLGPLIARRVKGAFLLGETREKLRASWSLFTPCSVVDSLLEAVAEAARNALPGDVVLLSPACPSFDQFQNYQHRGEVFRQAVCDLPSRRADSTGENRDDSRASTPI